MRVSCIFTALEIKTYTVKKCICTTYTVQTYSAALYVHYWHNPTLNKKRLSSHLTPREYAVLNGDFVFDLCDVIQEHIPGITQNLPVNGNYSVTLGNEAD